MLTLLIGADWVANTDAVMALLRQDVQQKRGRRILIVPELISHDTERLLCETCGNTSSRYGEVLTFTRLAQRVSEYTHRAVLPCLDDGGRVVAMAGATRQLASKLKSYASVETKPEFLMGLLDAVDEFKRCCISSEDLQIAALQSEGIFAQKLEELSLILGAYDGLCAQGRRDPRDQMTWLLEELEDCDFAANHTFYIDGFPDFTRQNMAIIEHILQFSPNVTISLNCDDMHSQNPAFEKAAETAGLIVAAAKRLGIKTEIKHISYDGNPLLQVSKKLFGGSADISGELFGCLRVGQPDSIQQECGFVAERILELVRGGARFRDISLVCADMSAYKNTLTMLLDRYHIPYYLSGTDDILDKSVISTVLTALDAACCGFERGDVLRYLKSPLSVLRSSDCDVVENYAIIWNISGTKWFSDWKNHPDGLSAEWTDASLRRLNDINEAKNLALLPLKTMADSIKGATSLRQVLESVYRFLEQIKMAERLTELAENFDRAGDNRNAQILNQLWEILLDALEQMYDMLGETSWEPESFARLLKLLLGQYSVGTIPTVLDSVTVGPVSAMRCERTKHLFVLGAVEGALPSYGGISGVLTDQERTLLRQMGVPLTGGALDGLKTQFSEIYGVFAGAQQDICVTAPGGQPSFVYRRLRDMAGFEMTIKDPIGPAVCDTSEAAAFLLRTGSKEAAVKLGITGEYEFLRNNAEHIPGHMERETVRKLYGDVLRLSASQIDKLADCRMAYFLKYGLKLAERKAAQIDPAEFGTYVHAVLEDTGRSVLERGGFKALSLEQVLELAKGHSDAYMQSHFAQLDDPRITYLLERNVNELKMIVCELWEEMQQSQFQPVGFEVSFGNGGEMDAVEVSGERMQAQLLGFVDRVDSWAENGQNYFRVVDYKTGKKDFDYCDIFNGLGLQMLLYLFALEASGGGLLGANAVPAGVQYFPARVPVIASEGTLSDDEVKLARQKQWKRKGLLLHNERVLNAMEDSDSPVRLPCTKKKDGTISGNLADLDQLKTLKRYVYHLLASMVDQIASGNVEANPYTRGSAHNACAFCPYGAVCHPEEVPGRRNYKALDSRQFWEEVDKAVKKLE